MMRKMPLFYFPPSICWVDDDSLFLNAAKQFFQTDYNCLAFENPQHALKYLDAYQAPSAKINFTSELTQSDIFDIKNHFPTDLNISEITNLINLPQIKNEEIGILVIDNNMPLISGLSICQELINTPFKKILLTGETHPTEVVNAFNQGIIDKFIPKDKNFSHHLTQTIAMLSYEYFYDRTESMINSIEASKVSPLSDPIFVSFFHTWFSSNEYKEFYLINKSGSFLVKNKDDSLAYFIVFTEHAKNEFLDLNQDATSTIGHLLEQFSQGKSIPFFGIDKESWDFNHTNWHKYFYPCNILVGREKYYWAIINEGEME